MQETNEWSTEFVRSSDTLQDLEWKDWFGACRDSNSWTARFNFIHRRHCSVFFPPQTLGISLVRTGFLNDLPLWHRWWHEPKTIITSDWRQFPTAKLRLANADTAFIRSMCHFEDCLVLQSGQQTSKELYISCDPANFQIFWILNLYKQTCCYEWFVRNQRSCCRSKAPTASVWLTPHFVRTISRLCTKKTNVAPKSRSSAPLRSWHQNCLHQASYPCGRLPETSHRIGRWSKIWTRQLESIRSHHLTGRTNIIHIYISFP